MRVGIIGAGIGGLSAAAGLKRAGADVEIFERTDELRASGSGLSVFGNGAKALAALGLAEAFDVRATPAERPLVGGQRKPNGRWLSRTPPAALAELRIIDRRELHDMLHAAVAGVSIHFQANARVRPSNVVRWAVGDRHEERAFDVIIAADGINSDVRRDLWGDTGAPRYAGYSAWRGISREPVDLHGEAGETWGRGQRFGIAPLRDGRVYWFAVASMPSNSAFENEYEEVQRRFSRWHDPIAEIIAKTEAGDVFRHDICDLARPLDSFVRGKVLLLGDAAHAMTPDLGQGANQAMEDAATLTALLAPSARDHSTPDNELAPVLERYDQLRRPRTQSIARQARRLGAFAQIEGQLGVWSRDLLMRLVPPHVMGKRMLAIQAWDPPIATC